MTPDPFRRPPMVDTPVTPGESIFWRLSHAMDRLVEKIEGYEPAEPWFLDLLERKINEAGTCPRCGHHPDRNCGCTADACGCTSPEDTPHEEPDMTTTRTPTDAEVDHLSSAVDRAFAERDRLDDVARRTGRDEDLAAMLRQDEHAARLLDQYNAAVAAQMAESDRQRAENLRRYAEQERQRRHEQEADRRTPGSPDASSARLDPPPAAEPYGSPTYAAKPTGPPRPTTTAPPGGTGMSIEAARAQIMGGHETGQAALRAIGQAHGMVGDARNDLWQATESSNQAEAEPARAQLQDAMDKLEEAEQQVAQALSEFEGIAQRL
jgi:hypothetical protein